MKKIVLFLAVFGVSLSAHSEKKFCLEWAGYLSFLKDPHSLKNKKAKIPFEYFSFSFVALPGFEPGQAVPETDVLPLHHKAILFRPRI